MPWLLAKVFWLRDDSQVDISLRLQHHLTTAEPVVASCPYGRRPTQTLHTPLHVRDDGSLSGTTSRYFGLQRAPESSDQVARAKPVKHNGTSDLRATLPANMGWRIAIVSRRVGESPMSCGAPPKLNSHRARRAMDGCRWLCTIVVRRKSPKFNRHLLRCLAFA